MVRPWRIFVLLCLAVVVLGTGALWYVVLPDWPEEAIADGMIAAAFASLATALFGAASS